ncbi:Pentatricopeptide repeat [Dillenia turbinata]|uniref:Pentatricopeptide repeat n=1 Tax=Dillenia turbinata TaxID=194707 RepID=A0AAN8W2B0_9MAGN
MFIFKKSQSIKPIIPNNEALHLFTSSASIALGDFMTQQPQFHQHSLTNSDAHFSESSEPHFLHYVDPKFYISALIKCKNVVQIKQVHAQITVNGLLSNLVVANKLLYMYAEHKDVGHAYPVFDRMKEKDLFSWSVMVGGFAKSGDYLNCFMTFREIIRSGLHPDSYTLPFVIRVCRDLKDLQLGRLVHHIVCKLGLHSNPFVGAQLVDMYAKCKAIEDAGQLFDRMPNRDCVTWTVMIGACAECGEANKSLVLFDRMMEEGIVPDKVAMVAVVFSCKWNNVAKVRELMTHRRLKKTPGWTWIEVGDKMHKFGCRILIAMGMLKKSYFGLL